MLNRLFRGSAGLAYAAVRNQPKNIYSRVWKELPDKAFQDRAFCKNFLDINLHKNTKRTQRGLFNGKEPKSGNTYVFSDKHQRRKVKVNAHKKLYHSEILGKDLEILTSTNAMRTIRKYGGFDNYILMAKEHRMQSLYGEYLREMMLRKLNDPDFKVNEVYRDPVYEVHFKRKGKTLHKLRDKLKNYMWMPPEIRHTDLSEHYDVDEEHIPLRDRRKYEEIKFKIMNKEDINFDDEFIKKMKVKHEEDAKETIELRDIREEARRDYNKVFKSRFLKRRLAEHLAEARNFQSKHPVDIY